MLPHPTAMFEKKWGGAQVQNPCSHPCPFLLLFWGRGGVAANFMPAVSRPGLSLLVIVPSVVPFNLLTLSYCLLFVPTCQP